MLKAGSGKSTVSDISLTGVGNTEGSRVPLDPSLTPLLMLYIVEIGNH